MSFSTIAEVARLLRVKPYTVYSWARTGRLPGVVRIGGTIRVKRQVLERFLSDNDKSSQVEISSRIATRGQLNEIRPLPVNPIVETLVDRELIGTEE